MLHQSGLYECGIFGFHTLWFTSLQLVYTGYSSFEIIHTLKYECMSDKQCSEEEKVEKMKVLSLNTFPCSAVTCSVQRIWSLVLFHMQHFLQYSIY